MAIDPSAVTEIAEKLRDQLIRDEGYKPSAYTDSLGYTTVGVGHLIDARKGGRLPDSIIQDLLDYDIRDTIGKLFVALPWISQLSTVRQSVLVNMAFNMGVDGLLEFKHMLEALQAGNYYESANQMLNSKWATQVGSRATRLAQQMQTDQWQ